MQRNSPLGFGNPSWLRVLMLLGLVACATLFFGSVHRVWPLLDMDFFPARDSLAPLSRQHLNSVDLAPPANSQYSLQWMRDEAAMDYCVRTWGRDSAQAWLARGVPLAYHRIVWKEGGNPNWQRVQFLPGGSWGFYARWEDDRVADSLDVDSAQSIAQHFLGQVPEADDFSLVSRQSQRLEGRLEHHLSWERSLGGVTPLRQRWLFTVSGTTLTRAETALVLPAEALRQQRRDDGRIQALLFAGIVCAAFWGWLAVVSMLAAVRSGIPARLPARLVLVVALGFAMTYVLDRDRWFLAWDPLWPAALAAVRTWILRMSWDLPLLLLVFILAMAGIYQDRRGGGRRSRTLLAVLQGRLSLGRLQREIARGYGIALLCGALLSIGAWLLAQLPGGQVQLQPQGFFSVSINSNWPGLSTFFFFLAIALAEESGYRLFAGSWFLRRGLPLWVAIVVPAGVYGLIHAPLAFLPPLDPWWGRSLLLAGVGAVWGWGFWKYGTLVVILSHWAADLFIFNWPRWAAGGEHRIAALLTVMAPALVLWLWGFSCQIWRQYSRNRRN